VQPVFVPGESQPDSRTRNAGVFGNISYCELSDDARQAARKCQAIVFKHASLMIVRFQA
jgi:hypothetical protein